MTIYNLKENTFLLLKFMYKNRNLSLFHSPMILISVSLMQSLWSHLQSINEGRNVLGRPRGEVGTGTWR